MYQEDPWPDRFVSQGISLVGWARSAQQGNAGLRMLSPAYATAHNFRIDTAVEVRHG